MGETRLVAQPPRAGFAKIPVVVPRISDHNGWTVASTDLPESNPVEIQAKELT
jgi:hypothetical protein